MASIGFGNTTNSATFITFKAFFEYWKEHSIKGIAHVPQSAISNALIGHEQLRANHDEYLKTCIGNVRKRLNSHPQISKAVIIKRFNQKTECYPFCIFQAS
jgi:hypothetical protein